MLRFLCLALMLSGCTFFGTSEIPSDREIKFSGEQAYGCGDFFVYKESHIQELYVTISSDIELSDVPLTVDASDPRIEIKAYHYAPTEWGLFCNDVLSEEIELLDSWDAASGTITLSRGEVPGSDTYTVTGQASDLEFESETTDDIHVAGLRFSNVTVGWFPG